MPKIVTRVGSMKAAEHPGSTGSLPVAVAQERDLPVGGDNIVAIAECAVPLTTLN